METSTAMAIGIDLGTTFSCVAVLRSLNHKPEIIPNEVGKNTTPSYVAYADEDVYAGQTAKDLAHMNTETTVFDFKRLIGRSFHDSGIQRFKQLWPFHLVNSQGMVGVQIEDQILLPQVIAKELVHHLITTAQDFLGCPVTSAVITVPVYFNDLQEALTREACLSAGLQDCYFITEPAAAAFAYGLHSSLKSFKTNTNISKPTTTQSKTCLIFDLGGGTFDVTIFKLDEKQSVEILAVGGDARLGGEDFNDILTQYCIEEFQKKHHIDLTEGKSSTNPVIRAKAARSLRRIRNECEKQKCFLSQITKVVVSLDGLHEHFEFAIPVSRKIFEELIRGHLDRCINEMDNLLKKKNIEKDDIDEVVLIGGSTRIPKIQEMLSEYFGGKTLHRAIDPDEAVACGAALHAYNVFHAKTCSNTAVTLVKMEANLDSIASERYSNSIPNSNKKILTEKEEETPSESLASKSKSKTTQVSTPEAKRNAQIEEEIKSLDNTAQQLIKNKEYTQAIETFKELFKLQKPLLGEDDPKTLATQFGMAHAMNKDLEYDKAMHLASFVFRQRKRVLGSHHEDTLEVQHYLARILQGQGKYKEALDLYEQAHEGRKVALGSKHLDTLYSKYGIADCLSKENKYEEAYWLYNFVYKARKDVLGSYHKDTLAAWNSMKNCGENMKVDDNPSKPSVSNSNSNSKTSSQKDVKSISKGDDIKTLDSLAQDLVKNKKHVEALETFEKLLKKQKKSLGENHPDTLATQFGMAHCLNKNLEYTKAMRLTSMVFKQRKRDLGSYHKDTLEAQHYMARILGGQGKYKEALDVYKEVHEFRKTVLGQYHLDTLYSKYGIADCLYQEGKYEEAYWLYNFVYRARRDELGPYHEDTVAAIKRMDMCTENAL